MKKIISKILRCVLSLVIAIASIPTFVYGDMTITTLTLGKTTVTTVYGQPMVYEFTPQTTGIYRFVSYADGMLSDPVLRIYDEIRDDSDWENDDEVFFKADDEVERNFDNCVTLEAEKKYYVSIGAWSAYLDTFDISVELLENDTVLPTEVKISLNDPQFSLIYGATDIGYFTFDNYYRTYDYYYIAKNLKMHITYSDASSKDVSVADCFESDSNNLVYDGKPLVFSLANGGYWDENGDNNFIEFTYAGLTSNKLEIPVRASTVADIDGFQISTTNQGIRTVYSVSDATNTVTETGLIYGLEEQCSKDELVIDSTNPKVYKYQSTTEGLSPVTVSDMPYAKSYVMTMKFDNMMTEFLAKSSYVRAYAKYTVTKNVEGQQVEEVRYVYSDVAEYSVYSVADALYQGNLMNSEARHNFLYDRILSRSNPEYKMIEYVKKEDYVLTR